MLPPHLVERALESAPDAIVISDASGSIVFANSQVVALFGYGKEELLGLPVELLLPERFRERHLSHRARFTVAPRTRPMGVGLELRARRKNGTEFPVEISLSSIGGCECPLVAAAVRDASDRERIESELLAARAAADRANQAKSRFLATASHDLRQPLQALSLLNGTLRRLHADGAAAEALAQQEQAINGMSRLVNALLDVSKLESGAIKPEITDFTVAVLFDELRREFAGLAADKGLDLEVDSCAAAIRSDASLVEQILRNLVSNAIKYTRRGKVLLRCLHESPLVRLEVLDTGIGIPAEQLPFIFDEFFQVGVAANTRRDGYGLGLSIVSRLVKLLDLRLDVRSEPGQGSSFRLDVPAATSRVCATRSEPPVEASLRLASSRFSRRVLLVEDDASVRNAIRMLLNTEGFEVVTAASCAEALRRLEEQPHLDLLVTDYHLGAGATGVEVIAVARQRFGAALPVILLTGDTSTDMQALNHDERWRMASKPLRANQLLTLMSELLER